MADEGLPAILRVTIDTDRYVLARHAGNICERLAIAYTQHQRAPASWSGRGLTLRVEGVQVSSLILDLISLGDAFVTLYENRDILAGFVAQLGDALMVMRGLAGQRSLHTIYPANRKAIEALAAPVAKDKARQVSVQVIGDNNTVIIIDAKAAADILANRPPVELRESEPITAARPSREPALAAPPAASPALDGPGVWPPMRGTALYRNGQWFVVPEGETRMYHLGMPHGTMDEIVDGGFYEFRSHGPRGAEMLAKSARFLGLLGAPVATTYTDLDAPPGPGIPQYASFVMRNPDTVATVDRDAILEFLVLRSDHSGIYDRESFLTVARGYQPELVEIARKKAPDGGSVVIDRSDVKEHFG